MCVARSLLNIIIPISAIIVIIIQPSDKQTDSDKCGEQNGHATTSRRRRSLQCPADEEKQSSSSSSRSRSSFKEKRIENDKLIDCVPDTCHK